MNICTFRVRDDSLADQHAISASQHGQLFLRLLLSPNGLKRYSPADSQLSAPLPISGFAAKLTVRSSHRTYVRSVWRYFLLSPFSTPSCATHQHVSKTNASSLPNVVSQFLFPSPWVRFPAFPGHNYGHRDGYNARMNFLPTPPHPLLQPRGKGLIIVDPLREWEIEMASAG